MTVGIAPGRAKPRWLGLLIACTLLTLVAASVVSAFPPGPTTGNKDPFNPTDALADCNPPPNLTIATTGTAETTNTCNPGIGNVDVTWISDTVSGSATDNAWGQGDKSDCYLAKTGGVDGACVTQVFGIGAAKTDLQYHGIGLEKGTDGHDYLYSAIKRLNAGGITSSNANYNVEVNQLLDAYKPSPASTICPTGTTGGCNLWRSPGDLTFMTDWGGNQSSCNTATPAICAYVWIDKSTGTGKTPSPAASTCFNAKTDPCWGLLPGGSAALSENPDKAFGSINSGAGAVQPFTFTEIGIDLTASGLVGTGECRTFKDVWAHSRSSSSFTAELKDFIFGDVDISTCTTTETALQRVDCATDATIGSSSKTITLALAVGGSVCVKDIATVGGGATDGNVQFRYYSTQAACEADTTHSAGTQVGTDKAVNSSGVATSDKATFTTPGVRYFRAFYLGDGLSPSASACDEILTLTQNTSTSTLLHETTSGGADVSPAHNTNNLTILLGGYVTDVASVLPSAAVGSVSFRIYGGATAAADCAADTTGTGGTDGGANKTVSSGSATSDTKQFNSVGDFYWKAFFAGTSPYNNSASACDEIVHVQKVNVGIATAPWYYPNDKVTITSPNGGGPATGNVSFRLYDTAQHCQDNGGTAATGMLYSQGPVAIDANGVATTSNTTVKVETSGTVFWRITFTSTNTQQNDASSLCVESINATLNPDPVPAP